MACSPGLLSCMAHNKRFAKPGSTTAGSVIVQEITPASAGFFVSGFCGTRV
jgi:hypothetical protein